MESIKELEFLYENNIRISNPRFNFDPEFEASFIEEFHRLREKYTTDQIINKFATAIIQLKHKGMIQKFENRNKEMPDIKPITTKVSDPEQLTDIIKELRPVKKPLPR